jgi:hypothetical protein
MEFCMDHWTALRTALDKRGLEGTQRMSNFEHHTDWGVLSEDGSIYAVTPNDRETAERECLLLRQGDEHGQKEPSARVSEHRTCSWAGHHIHEPREALKGRETASEDEHDEYGFRAPWPWPPPMETKNG